MSVSTLPELLIFNDVIIGCHPLWQDPLAKDPFARWWTLWHFDRTLWHFDGTLLHFDGTLWHFDGTLWQIDGTL